MTNWVIRTLLERMGESEAECSTAQSYRTSLRMQTLLQNSGLAQAPNRNYPDIYTQRATIDERLELERPACIRGHIYT